MAKFKSIFIRSEYQIALNNYRKARRRGDVADAQRWIKLADMHLRVADRFEDGVHTARVRDAELASVRTAESRKHDQIDRFAQRRQLDDLEKQIEAGAEAMWLASKRAQASSSPR